MRVLALHTQTLYARATIPVLVELAARGHDVVVERQRHGLNSFGDRYVRSHPTDVKIVDRDSLRYVARLAGYGDDWARVEERIALARPRGRFDLVLGTTKDLERLREVAVRTDARALAVGYQHMPFLVAPAGETPLAARRSALLEENPFTAEHAFLDILRPYAAAAAGFTFMDRVREAPVEPRDELVLLHSGGWRGIETEAGEPRAAALGKQAAVLERALLPALEAGLRPVVKIHPLRARDHDGADVEELARGLEARHGVAEGTIDVLGPDEWAWSRILGAALVAGYGSSSLYELWSAGLRNAVVLDFEGTARSRRFRLFPSIVLGSHVEYVSLVTEGRFRTLELDPLADTIARAYAELFDGRATARALAAAEGAAA